jgi:hypothetical protein
MLILSLQGRIQDFKLGVGAQLKKLRRAEGGAKIFGVFRVKNHDFMPKNNIFSNFRGGARRETESNLISLMPRCGRIQNTTRPKDWF